MDERDKPNLYLVGFMGTGKSAIGRHAARRLGLQFLDSDYAIEQKEGRSIAEIFEEDGEPTFRAMERSFMEDGHDKRGMLIACGGGLIIESGMLEIVRSRGIVVSLLASPETVYERTQRNANRPLLNVEDPMGRIRSMLGEREPIYRKAGTEVLTDNRSIADVAAHVCRIYKREASSWK